MSRETCVNQGCEEPRDKGADKGHPFRRHIKDDSRLDLSACEELLSPAPIAYSNSKLCAACWKAREKEANQARIAIGEKAGAEGLQRELVEQLWAELRALWDRRKEPPGQAAFEGYLSLVLQHRAVPEKQEDQAWGSF